jgi:uncharacterized protein YegL
MADFELQSYQNEYLPAGARDINAVIMVTATRTGPSGGSARPGEDGRAEVIMLDTSRSMEGERIREAKLATAAAIDCLPDGVRFAVVSGNHMAYVAYPDAPPLVVASPSTRADAKEAVRRLEVGGGTAIGTWLDLAAHLLRDEPGIKHAILLTDGRNEHEEPEVLDAYLARAEGAFQCDCRGVGADWDVAELRKIATALLGSYDIVAEPSQLTADFAEIIRQALGRQVPEVTLRVWTPQGAEVTLFKQLEPMVLDLTKTQATVGPQVRDYPTGSWGDESRDYHLGVRVVPGQVGEEVLAARVILLVGGESAGQCLVTAVWTDDVAQSTKMNKKVADAMGDAELADAIDEGIDAHRAGDIDTATNRFALAARLAREHGNEEALARVAAVVDIEDAATGRVRPKAKVDDLDLMILETRSTRTKGPRS